MRERRREVRMKQLYMKKRATRADYESYETMHWWSTKGTHRLLVVEQEDRDEIQGPSMRPVLGRDGSGHKHYMYDT